MSSGIAKIGQAAPCDALIKDCENLLDRAKSGELRSLVWAGSLSGGLFARGMSTHDAIEAAGLAYMMLHGIGHNCMQNPEGEG